MTQAAFSNRCRLARPAIDVVGTFDLTDEVIRLAGQGWYKYEKAKFLSATFEFRVCLAAARQAKLLEEALEELPARLTALWGSPEFTAREKRRIVCLLWAEVDVAHARSRVAADTILTWVRDRLPPESRDAYGAAELAACAADGRPFSPYGVVSAE